MLIIPFMTNAKNIMERSYHCDTGDVFVGFSSGVDISKNVYRIPDTDALGASYKTKKTDGDTSRKKYADLNEYYPHSIAGAGCSMIFKYDPNGYRGLTFTPEYTNFLRPFQYVNTNNYQRFSFNAGIELHIYQ